VTEEHLSYCRICAAACGIVVTVDGSRVTRVRGDAEHPVSRGYTCSKARALPQWHHASARLDHPRLRGSDASWDDVLDDLSGVLGATIDAQGSSAIALYLATGLAYDAAGQVAAGTWMRSIGSRSFYSAATVDNAPVLVAAELVAGNPMLNPVWDPTEPGLLVLVGTNPVVSHGYGTSLPDPIRHLRDYRGLGGRVWVIDPRRTETAALADAHLAVRPGSDVVLLAALAAALLVRGADGVERCAPEDLESLRRALTPFTVERAAAAADVASDDIDRLIDEIHGAPGRLAVMCGTGTTMGTDGILVEWLRWVLLILSGSLDRAGGMRFNRGAINRLRPPPPPPAPRISLDRFPERDRAKAEGGRSGRHPSGGPASRPELPRVAGQMPAVALVDEIESGNVRALVVTGGNPITAFPEPDRLRAALGSLDALAVVDVMENELTDRATHVLPAAGQLERADLSIAELTAVRSGLQSTGAVVEPVGERRPVWWALGSLARHMDRDILGGVDPDELTDELVLSGLLAHSPVEAEIVFAAGPRGIDVPEELGWVRETMLPGGHWQVAPPVMLERLAGHVEPGRGLVLIPRREMAWSNSVRYAGTGREPVVRMHPDDAHAAGVTDGESATVTSAHGRITATVAVDPHLRVGAVSATHGHERESPGRLTSTRVEVDPLTTMPHASGLPVAVTATLEERREG
jgi:anaerobic selenocysteine-containing dehydrogenase